MTEPILPCFVCDKTLSSVWPDASDDEQQADGACYFRSHGQYGSTIFDPMDRTYLEINICDECLRANPQRALVCKPQVTTRRSSQIWDLLDRDDDD